MKITRPDGTLETCGKCAAVGTNSKGPGAHSPGCPAAADTARAVKAEQEFTTAMEAIYPEENE